MDVHDVTDLGQVKPPTTLVIPYPHLFARILTLNPVSQTTRPPDLIHRSHPTPAAILAASFSPTNPSLAYTAGLDKRLRQWDFERNQERVLGKSEEGISCLVVVRDSMVVTGGWDGGLRVWDP